MNYVAETEQLLLREWLLSDASFVFELLNSAGWIKYIGNRNINQLSDAEEYITQRLQAGIDKNNFGFWCVVLKSTQLPIGMVGIVEREWLECPDFGFAFLPQYQGKNRAYEASSSVLDLAKNTFGFKNLCAITLPENQRSIQLLERLKFTFQKEISDPDTNEILNVYEIDL